MRNLVLSLLCVGLSSSAWAQEAVQNPEGTTTVVEVPNETDPNAAAAEPKTDESQTQQINKQTDSTLPAPESSPLRIKPRIEHDPALKLSRSRKSATPQPSRASKQDLTPEDPNNCTGKNLLAGRKPLRNVGARDVNRITDGQAPNEGSNWQSSLTSTIDDKGYLVYDLGNEYPISALLLQGDNNDTYSISGSLDGKNFTPIWKVPEHPNMGMRTRVHQVQGEKERVRYIKLSEMSGDGYYSVGEMQVYCSQPAVWPPALEVKQATKPVQAPNKKDIESQRKIALALLGLIAFVGVILGHRRQNPWLKWLGAIGGAGALIYAATRTAGNAFLEREQDAVIVAVIGLAIWALILAGRAFFHRPLSKTLERGTLLCILIASMYTWTNWGVFHGTRAVHYWDTFHYYVGSKYFDEVGYDLIYKCTALAEADDGHEEDVMKRQMRDLTNNDLLQASVHLADRSDCDKAFTPERWAALQQDMRLFRSVMGVSWWSKMFKDHGFNATPVWTLVGARITNLGWKNEVPPPELVNSPKNLAGKSAAERKAILDRFEADKAQFMSRVNRVALIDASFYAIIFLAIWWAFGLRAAAMASLIWATGYPWAYFWTGGSYMRVTWLFMAVLGVCLMKKGFKVLGGFGVTWSGLLRVFPCALAGGVTLQVIYNLIRKRTVLANHRRIILGACLAVAILVPSSIVMNSHGADVYPAFLGNSIKHTETPLTNNMGLKTLMSYSPSKIARKTKTDKHADPFHDWKLHRKATFKSHLPFHAALLVAAFAMLLIVGRKVEDWEITALSTVLLFGIFEMTCYYYSWCILLAPVVLRRLRYVVVTLAMCITTQLAQLNISWYDEQYTLCSLAVFICLFYILGDLTYRSLRNKPMSRAEELEDKADLAEQAREEAQDEELIERISKKPAQVEAVSEQPNA